MRTASRCASPAAVVLIEPDIELSEVLAGGVEEPRREWTEAARRLYPQAVRRSTPAGGIAAGAGLRHPRRRCRPIPASGQILRLERGRVDERARVYVAREPARNQARQALDWTLGPGVAELRKVTGADYALFTYIRDSYTSGGRKALRIATLLLLGGDIGGGAQVGVTTLVDLRTGQVVWFNFLAKQTGDLRDEAGARQTAKHLSEGPAAVSTAPHAVAACGRAGDSRRRPPPNRTQAATPVSQRSARTTSRRRHRRGRALVRDGAHRTRAAAVAAAGARPRSSTPTCARCCARSRVEYCRDLRLYLVDVPWFNASMAPNGVMILWTGSLLRIRDEAQLALVLGHEFGHYRERHTLQQWRKLKRSSAFLGAFGVLASGAGVGVAGMVGEPRRPGHDDEVHPRQGARGRSHRLRAAARARLRRRRRRRAVGGHAARRRRARLRQADPGVLDPPADPRTPRRPQGRRGGGRRSTARARPRGLPRRRRARTCATGWRTN